MRVSAGDGAGGDEGARRRRSFQIRLHAAMGACIAPAFPVGGMGGSPWWLYVVFRERTCPWLVPHSWHRYLLWEGRKGWFEGVGYFGFGWSVGCWLH